MEVTTVAPRSLHIDVLPRATGKAFLLCSAMPLFQMSRWYLAGGTALALQVGHRSSVDLDFFTPQSRFDTDGLEKQLLLTNVWESTLKRKGTLYGKLGGTKMSFIAYPFFCPSNRHILSGTIRLLLPEDIAAMKIVAVSQRGRKRDFVDLYWYTHHREPLLDVLKRAVHQYPGQEHNLPHILKSLTYFADAENDPMPSLFFTVSWREIKAYFQQEVPRIAKILLKLG